MKYLSALHSNIDLLPNVYMPNSLPVWFKGNSPSKAIAICLHGYTATVYESRPIAEAIFKAGIDAACPLLPGHGLKDEKSSKRVMAGIKYEDWLSAIRDEISLARNIYKKVFIFGQSMGGAIALRMAEENLVDACATTAPAIKLPRIYETGLQYLGKFDINFHMEAKHTFFNEAYSYYNFKATLELLKMSILVRNNLSSVSCPALTFFTPEDKAIDTKGASNLVRENISHARIKWFLGDHCMTLDESAKAIKKIIATFFLESI